MVVTCCIVGCSKRRGRDKGVTFHSIPAIVQTQGERTKDLTSRRRLEWIARINRKDWNPSPHSRVCSEHFLSGIRYTYQ